MFVTEHTTIHNTSISPVSWLARPWRRFLELQWPTWLDTITLSDCFPCWAASWRRSSRLGAGITWDNAGWGKCQRILLVASIQHIELEDIPLRLSVIVTGEVEVGVRVVSSTAQDVTLLVDERPCDKAGTLLSADREANVCPILLL